MGSKRVYRVRRPRTADTRFLVCSNRPGTPWFFLPWNIGKSLGQGVSEPIVYFADLDLEPEDLQLTNGIQFLVSARLLEIMMAHGVNVEVFRSEIVFPNGRVESNYFSLNYLDVFSVVDRERSVFKLDPDFPEAKIYEIKHLVLKEASIPSSPAFIMQENVSYLLMSEDLKEDIQRHGITGMVFEKIDVA